MINTDRSCLVVTVLAELRGGESVICLDLLSQEFEGRNDHLSAAEASGMTPQ
jgi:hypothetical protein